MNTTNFTFNYCSFYLRNMAEDKFRHGFGMVILVLILRWNLHGPQWSFPEKHLGILQCRGHYNSFLDASEYVRVKSC